MKNKIKEAFNELNPEEIQERQIFYKIKDKSRKIEKEPLFSFKKPIIIAVSLIAVIFAITPVLASNAPYIYDLMYLVSPRVAQSFMPVEKSNIDNGIKMEVISAYIHRNEAQVYITMQDLIGDRIDETTDLYDSYSINRPFDSGAYCERIGFDENTKKATFLLVINEWGNTEIKGDKITFTVKEFLSHRENFNNVSIPLDFSMIKEAKNIQKVNDGVSYVDGLGKLNEEKTVLVPSSKIARSLVDGIDISAIGYIEDKFHIQIRIPNRLKNDNFGSFYLKDKRGNIVEDDYFGIYFSDESKSDENKKDEDISYIEYVFDIPKEEIEEYSLYGDFKINKMRTEGSWRVTFPLEER